MSMSLSILAFGAHPDDVEIGAAGILAKHAKAGHAVGICNLTRAELSSNGTPVLRQKEADRSAKILGVSERIQLDLGDRRLRLTHDMIDQVIQVIRKYRPKIVLSPPPKDRHPDHEWCYQLVREALFSSGLRNYLIGAESEPPFRPSFFYQYLINDTHTPSIVVDVSEVYQLKKSALLAYVSQFTATDQTAATVLNQGTFLQAIEGRDALFGQASGVRYAEGLLCDRPILFHELPV